MGLRNHAAVERGAAERGVAIVMDAFTKQMLETALWSSMDNADDSGGEPLDKNYSIRDFSGWTLRGLARDAKRFQRENAADLAEFDSAQAGHDFWLTRNGHGAGFWDGDYPEPQATRLTNASKRFREVDLYVGDDGKIYASGYEGPRKASSPRLRRTSKRRIGRHTKPGRRRSPLRVTGTISWRQLPKAALRQMSARQRSYIDEFEFKKLPNGIIQAWYGGQHLANWDGKYWMHGYGNSPRQSASDHDATGRRLERELSRMRPSPRRKARKPGETTAEYGYTAMRAAAPYLPKRPFYEQEGRDSSEEESPRRRRMRRSPQGPRKFVEYLVYVDGQRAPHSGSWFSTKASAIAFAKKMEASGHQVQLQRRTHSAAEPYRRVTIHERSPRGSGRGRYFYITQGRLGPTAVLIDYKGASINVINGDRSETVESIRRVAHKHWPGLPERAR
jgi:hypothetical protein